MEARRSCDHAVRDVFGAHIRRSHVVDSLSLRQPRWLARLAAVLLDQNRTLVGRGGGRGTFTGAPFDWYRVAVYGAGRIALRPALAAGHGFRTRRDGTCTVRQEW